MQHAQHSMQRHRLIQWHGLERAVPFSLPAIPLPAIPLPAIPLPAIPLPAIPLPAIPLPAIPLPAIPLPAIPLPVVTGPSSPPQQTDVLQEIYNGYKKFVAQESQLAGNPALGCTAKLYYLNGGLMNTVAGATHCGVHAEMSAIHNFYVGICNYNNHAFGSVNLYIESGATPCCVRCAAVIGLLGIKAMPNTFKTPKSVGATQWKIPESIAKLLAIKMGNKESLYKQFGSAPI